MSKRERQRAARRRGRVEQRQRERREEARVRLAYDPATEPDKAADILRRMFGQAPVGTDVAATLVLEGDIGRARRVADAALRGAHDPMALSLAADVALLDGRPADAERHVVRALEQADRPELHIRLASALVSQGRVAGAIEVFDAQLAVNPGLEELQLARGAVLGLAHDLAVTGPTECPCGSGEAYAACCGPGDRRAIERFRDRGPLIELHAAVSRYVVSTDERSAAFADAVTEWLEAGAATEAELEARSDGVHPEPRTREAARLQMIGEWAWLASTLDGGQPLLDQFSADPDLPDDLRRRAADWLGWAMWGLWEVGDPRTAPGTFVTELLTGVRLYAELPPALLEGMPRWSVLLGCMVPVDGVWRAGGGFELATPIEARELAHELMDEILEHPEDFGREGRPMVAWGRRAHDRMGELWLPAEEDRPSPEALAGLQATLRGALPHLVAGLRRMQGTIEWEQEAGWYALDVDDPDAAWAALAARDRFVLDEDGDLMWRNTADDDEARALLARTDEGIAVELESPDDLPVLLDLLEADGHQARVVDLAPERPEPPIALPEPAVVPAWLLAFPDEAQPALDDLTPREAIARHRAAAEVEMLLRYVEFEADARGFEGLDTDRVRRELGLEEEAEPAG